MIAFKSYRELYRRSLRHQIEAGRRPSVKQIDTLDNVWERATARG